jgi:ABC-type transporter Mla subunit MlaD
LHSPGGVSTPNDATRPARRGLFILIALVVVAILVFNLREILDLPRRQIDVVAMVKDAPGVRSQTEVWAEGVKVGRVKKVTLTEYRDSVYVALDLRLDARVTDIITADSDVRASRQRFIGDPLIRLFAGAPGDPPLRAGDTIVGKPRLSPEQLIARAELLPATLDSLMDAARLVQTRFEARQPHVEQMGDQIRAVADAAAALAVEMEGGSLGRMLDGRTGLPAHMNALRQRVSDLGGAAQRMTERYSPHADAGLAAHLDALRQRASNVETALAELQAMIDEGEGFIARAQADTAIQVAIRGIQIQLDSLKADAFSIALRMFLP